MSHSKEGKRPTGERSPHPRSEGVYADSVSAKT